MLLSALISITILFTLTSPAISRYSSPSPPAAPFSESPDEWLSARATYYASADNPRDAVGGACGYGDLLKASYGIATAGLSEALFGRGQICGACFELRCVEEETLFDRRWCISGTSVIVTATNFCAPNYGFDAESNGGHCNPPKQHFVVPIEAFEKIAIWKAGNMPVKYRRIKCRREGGIRFTITGSGIFVSVLISNVGGTGDIVAVKVKGSRTGWLPMGRNWGQNWHVSALLQNQPLSFEVTSSDGITVTSYNVAPKDWSFGQTFVGRQFES
ncbi:expansin-A13-like [Gastrolobium bilobum]|uniref:expansin-A13-like n=1 Tax=Gastrolobium bilobum TaxID=150636 RepID=UPI002AB16318|nr:expansin-A13-like [Gastrolobium bilobum]